MARVKGDWLIPLPAGLTGAEAMAIGTAGYTAMLCDDGARAARHHAGSAGRSVVTGAAGGVGSMAIALLAPTAAASVARGDRPRRGGRLPQGARRRRDRRPRRAHRAGEAARQGALGGRHRRGRRRGARQRHLDDRAMAAPSPPAAMPAAWSSRPRSRPSSCAACRCSASIPVRAPKPLRIEAWKRLARDLDREASSPR